MVDTVSDFRQIFLTYNDIKENNPQWSDKMIEDYLALKKDLTDVSETTDTTFDSSYFDSVVEGLSERIEELEGTRAEYAAMLALQKIDDLSFKVVSTSVNYTTDGNEIIICTNTGDITVTLNSSPEDTEQVHIVRQNSGGVTISGVINGQSSLVVGQRYSSPHLVYTVDGGEWSII